VSYDIGVQPKVTFTLNDHASIITYYKLSQSKVDFEGAKTITANKVQVNFEWTF
jgi:hypothetical protein